MLSSFSTDFQEYVYAMAIAIAIAIAIVLWRKSKKGDKKKDCFTYLVVSRQEAEHHTAFIVRNIWKINRSICVRSFQISENLDH